MKGDIWSSLLPLMGVLIGAFLQFWFSRAAEKRRQMEALRNESYVDYLRSVAKSAYSQSANESRAAAGEAADAKARIAIYGSPTVISALARFEETGARFDNELSVERFVAVAEAMRENEASARDLKLVLFGPD